MPALEQRAGSREQGSVIGAALCSLLFALCSSAQLKESINVHLVEVPVTVTDRDGNPIRGLTAANFEIYDEGRKREITTFDKIDFASAEAKSASALNPAARRSFLLLFDMSFSSPVGRAKAQEAARNFIARGLQRRDLAAVATVDVERGFRMLTSFTTDKSLLTAAILNPRLFTSSDPLQIAGTDVLEAPKPLDDPASGERDVNGVAEQQAEIARLEKVSNDSYNRARIERQIAQLGGMAKTLRNLPGRKQVIFFSEGFDARLVQGREAHAMADSLADLDLVIHGQGFKTDSDSRYGNSATMSILDQMARSFRGSDVVLHAVDIAGVRVNNSVQTGLAIRTNEALYLVTNPTGGEVFRNSNDITSDMERLLHRQEVVYVLGFQTQSADATKFHNLKVRAAGLNGAKVQHRAGYWEGTKENAVERMLTTAEIVINDIPQNDIGVATLAVPFPGAKNARVPVIVEINGSDLLRGARVNPVSAEIYVYAFDDEGVVRDRMFQRVALDASKVADKLRERGIKYYTTLSLPEGTYAVKTLVRVPETERKGYARNDLIVPKWNDVAVLQPMFVEQPGQWLMVKGGSHDEPSAGYPFEINGESFIPSAAVHVKKGEPRDFAVFVYNAAPDEVAWEATLDARPANPSLVRQTYAADVTKLMFRYAPDDLAATPSSNLAFTIRKKGSADARHASVRLSVER